KPVRLPPKRLRLATTPSLTGSSPMPKTIGIVAVAAFAAMVAGGPATWNASTRRLTSSAASAGSWSTLPDANRLSKTTFWPSTNPASLSPCANSRVRGGVSPGDHRVRKPTTCMRCCARAVTGHAAALPSRVMNWRRLMPSMGFLWAGLYGGGVQPARLNDSIPTLRRQSAAPRNFVRLDRWVHVCSGSNSEELGMSVSRPLCHQYRTLRRHRRTTVKCQEETFVGARRRTRLGCSTRKASTSADRRTRPRIKHINPVERQAYANAGREADLYGPGQHVRIQMVARKIEHHQCRMEQRKQHQRAPSAEE